MAAGRVVNSQLCRPKCSEVERRYVIENMQDLTWVLVVLIFAIGFESGKVCFVGMDRGQLSLCGGFGSV